MLAIRQRSVPKGLARSLRFLRAVSLCALAAGAASATTVTGLSEALVPVGDRTDAVRAEATMEAMRQVLIKLTGDRNAASSERGAAMIREAGSYVLQYQYRQHPGAGLEGAADERESMLWVQFDETALTDTLRAAGVPLWGNDRPSLLMWLLAEQSGSVALAGSEEPGPLSESLRGHAARRGIPLVLPLLDLEETARIAPGDVKQENVGRIREASARYGTPATATAVLTGVAETGWQGRFTLQFRDRSSTWLARAESIDAMIGQGMDRLADALAASALATGPSGAGETVKVEVEGVDTVQQFAQVEAYLRSLSTVNRVDMQRLEPGRAIFSVVSRGGLQGIGELVARDAVLQGVGAAGEGRFRLLR